MKKRKKRAVIMAMVGAIIGIMLSVVFSKSPMVLAFIPVAGAIGGLFGMIIDKRRNKNLP